MPPRLITRRAAESEIAEAAAWYDAQRLGLGDEFLDAVDVAIAAAFRAPAQYRRVHRDLRRVLVHRFPYGLIFRASADEFVVLACMHLRRDPRRWRSRR